MTNAGFLVKWAWEHSIKDNVSASVVSRECKAIDLFLELLGPEAHEPMGKVRSSHVEKLKETLLREGYCPMSINQRLAVLRSAFSAAKKAGRYNCLKRKPFVKHYETR